MKAPSLTQLKKELHYRSSEELAALCVRLARFKKENKELLAYLLFEVEDEAHYVDLVKTHITERFQEINTSNFYYIKKSIRKILRETKKYIRYSSVKETEVVLLLHFCETLRAFRPNIETNAAMMRLYHNQLALIKRKLTSLHEDLQYDYRIVLQQLEETPTL